MKILKRRLTKLSKRDQQWFNEVQYNLPGNVGDTYLTKVIYNNPATIAFWEDGSKTIVKVQDGDTFDKEKGLAMALLKKLLGNNGNYYKEIKRWTEDENDR